MTVARHLFFALILEIAVAVSAYAQAPPDAQGEHHHDAASHSWAWTTDANVFVGYNDQERHFADFSAWESQNWFMGSGSRSIDKGRLTIGSMLSLEPFTLHPHGSPQLFQTGESYKKAPLLNYQHPHDLVMELGATYERPLGRVRGYVGADLVGSPTLGPIPFMHRESARSNPQVPLTHHFMDSTHITTGVVRGGLSVGPLTFESSAFRGLEPDEDRLNLERPGLDSWAARVQYHAGPWHAQFSGGHLHQPEWFDPFDITLFTASLGFDGQVGARPLDVTLAWGGHREFNGFNGNADGFLAEGQYGVSARSTFYGRVEHTGKDLFVDVHAKGASHRTIIYMIDAFTAGYIQDVSATRFGRFGLGADATFYLMPDTLLQFWQSSRSFHAFLRWRPRAASHDMSQMHM